MLSFERRQRPPARPSSPAASPVCCAAANLCPKPDAALCPPLTTNLPILNSPPSPMVRSTPAVLDAHPHTNLNNAPGRSRLPAAPHPRPGRRLPVLAACAAAGCRPALGSCCPAPSVSHPRDGLTGHGGAFPPEPHCLLLTSSPPSLALPTPPAPGGLRVCTTLVRSARQQPSLSSLSLPFFPRRRQATPACPLPAAAISSAAGSGGQHNAAAPAPQPLPITQQWQGPAGAN